MGLAGVEVSIFLNQGCRGLPRNFHNLLFLVHTAQVAVQKHLIFILLLHILRQSAARLWPYLHKLAINFIRTLWLEKDISPRLGKHFCRRRLHV